MTHGENPWKLQSLSLKHKQVAGLLAQGLGPLEVCRAMDVEGNESFTPQYVTMLTRDPLFKDYLSHLCELAGVQLEALFVQSVEVIREGLQEGRMEDRLRAARLQLEATKRIGKHDRDSASNEDTVNRLARLAERLSNLNQRQLRQPETIDGTASEIPA